MTHAHEKYECMRLRNVLPRKSGNAIWRQLKSRTVLRSITIYIERLEPKHLFYSSLRAASVRTRSIHYRIRVSCDVLYKAIHAYATHLSHHGIGNGPGSASVIGKKLPTINAGLRSVSVCLDSLYPVLTYSTCRV